MFKILIIGYDWYSLFQRCHQIASALARTNEVLYWGSTSFWGRKIWEAARSGHSLRIFSRPVPGLTVLTIPEPLPYALRHTPTGVHFVLTWWETGLLSHDKLGAPFDAAILATYSPVDTMIWARVRAEVKVYDCYDDNVHFFAAGSRAALAVAQTEAGIIKQADLVLASAPRIYERIAATHHRVIMVPNGADIEHFAEGGEESPGGEGLKDLGGELAGITAPILGFVGAIESWIDVDLIADVADQLREYSIVMVGPVRCDVQKLRKRSNIILMGRREYADLPGLVRRFDVCMIPFKDNELTRAVDPVKFYEYCAAGKPVVSTPLPTMMMRADLAYTAATPEEFAGQVRRAREEDNEERRQARLTLAAENSWEARADTILTALRAALLAGNRRSRT